MPNQLTNVQLQANIWKFYFLGIFGAAVGLALPVIVLFWQDNGLTLTQVTFLQSALAITLIVLEVPSGYIADIFGRKKVFIWGALCYLLSIIIYIFGYSFIPFLLAEISFAVGLSLLSGADSAFLYDTLKELKREADFKTIYGKSVFYRLGATAIFSLIGGYIATFDMRYTWIAALIPGMLMVILSLYMFEPRRHKLIYDKGYTKTLLKVLHTNVLKQTKLKWLIIYAAIIFAFYHSAYWLYQPLLELTGIKVAFFGVIFAAFFLVSGIVSKYAHPIEERLGKKKLFISLTLITGITLLLMSKFLFLFTFSFIFLHAFVRGIYTVVVTDYVNQLTDSSIRATVLSMQNLVARFVFAIIAPLAGVFADIYTVPQALGIMGVTVLISGGGVLFVLHRFKLI